MQKLPTETLDSISQSRTNLANASNKLAGLKSSILQAQNEITRLSEAIAKTESNENPLSPDELEQFTKNAELRRLAQNRISLFEKKTPQTEKDLLEAIANAQQNIIAGLTAEHDRISKAIEDIIAPLVGTALPIAMASSPPLIRFSQVFTFDRLGWELQPETATAEKLRALDCLLDGKNPFPIKLPAWVKI